MVRRFGFSGLGVALAGVPPEIAARLDDLWEGYAGDGDPPPLVDATIAEAGRPMTPGRAMVPGMRSSIGPGAARFDQDEGAVTVAADGRTEIVLAAGPAPRRAFAVVNLVLAALGWRLPDRSGAALHAASVVLDGRAFVLVGPEGAGKTTWCRAARDGGAEVLSDDVTILVASRGGFDALATPFRHEPFPRPRPGRHPVAALLLPRHGAEPRLEPAPSLAVEARLAAHLLYVGSGMAGDPRVAPLLDALSRAASRTLTFAPDPGFVPLLRALDRSA